MKYTNIEHIGDLLYTIYPDRNFVAAVRGNILSKSYSFVWRLDRSPHRIENPNDKDKILLGLICKLPHHSLTNPKNIPDIFISDLVRLYAKLFI